MKTPGEIIKDRREEKKLSLAELARRAGVSKGYLYTIESGETKSPSAEVLLRIAKQLGTTIADLLGEEDPAEADKRIVSVDIPQSLIDFAKEAELPDSDIEMLARIEYRGKRPEKKEDWRFIYESIRRSLE